MTELPTYRERMAELAAVIAADTDEPPQTPTAPHNLPPALAKRIARIEAHATPNQQPTPARRTA